MLKTHMHLYLNNYCKRRNFTEQTMKSKRYILERFTSEIGLVYIKDLTNTLIDEWQLSLLRNNISPRTVNARTAHLMAFLKWCERERIDLSVQRNHVEMVSTDPVIRKAYSPKQVHKVLSMCRTERERLLISICFEAGLRLSELVHLQADDFDVGRDDEGYFTVIGKGRKLRRVFVTQKTSNRIQDWIIYNGIDTYLFPSQMHPEKPISIDQARSIMRKSFERTGLTGFKPHQLRYSFATTVTDNGADLVTVQKLLGHSNVRTTGLYIQRSDDRLQKAHAEYMIYA